MSMVRPEDLTKAVLKSSHFLQVRRILHDYTGIYLSDGKEALVRARLIKRLRAHGMGSFDEYLKLIENDPAGKEFLAFVDVLTTNKTNFFRENQHFDYIRDNILPGIQGRNVTWWCAGCSSGEEPYTAAITILEDSTSGSAGRIRILGTDISSTVLHKAKRGEYTEDQVRGVSPQILRKYFNIVSNNPAIYRIDKEVAGMISFARLNLQEQWPMKGPFNVIMCRNVMIYFNRETQQKLISRFYDFLEPGGHLFLGHSESITSFQHRFTNVCPAVYQKR